MCFPAMLSCPVAEKSCDLRVTFVNEACTNKQNFSSEEQETKKKRTKVIRSIKFKKMGNASSEMWCEIMSSNEKL